MEISADSLVCALCMSSSTFHGDEIHIQRTVHIHGTKSRRCQAIDIVGVLINRNSSAGGSAPSLAV